MPRSSTPTLTFTIKMSDGLYGLTKQERLWNKYARESMKEGLEDHHKKVIPLHFRLGAAGRYGYATRKGLTRKRKRIVWKKHPMLDLVRSGDTSKMIMERRQIKFSGSFGSGARAASGLKGRLIMWAPSYLKRSFGRGKIDFEQMSKEITAITGQEQNSFIFNYGRRMAFRIRSYHGHLRTVYRSRR